MSNSSQRITLKLKNPNPLFVQWLTEWYDKAVENNSKMQHCFKKALTSLKKYPIPLDTGADCKILQGFGDSLCKMLDKKLQEHNSHTPADLDATIPYQPTNKYVYPQVVNEAKRRSKKNRTVQPKQSSPKRSSSYAPKHRSGGYAILLGMYTRSLASDYRGFLNKCDVITAGIPYCDTSFTKADEGSYYTAWSSMKILLSKGIVVKEGNPARFSLTSLGETIAKKLKESVENEDEGSIPLASYSQCTSSMETVECQSNVNSVENKCETVSVTSETKSLTSTQSSSSNFPITDPLILAPYSFEVVLLVDTQETIGKNKVNDELLLKLKSENVAFEVRHLNLGDYLWICREKCSKRELVLPYIIERKRMDDLGGSIKDGRYHEQKFRLKRSGIQNLIYLIESHGNNEHVGLPILTLYQAATNTMLRDGFSVKFTDNLNGTVHYLSAMSNILVTQFRSKTLVGCPKETLEKHSIADEVISLMEFAEFNKAASKAKKFKVQDFFVRQLLQLKGVSAEKAFAIVKEYPTPFLLCSSFEGCPEPEKMLATIKYGKLQKNIGPVISKCLFELYTRNEF